MNSRLVKQQALDLIKYEVSIYIQCMYICTCMHKLCIYVMCACGVHCRCLHESSTLLSVPLWCTVDHLNEGHFRAASFVLCKEIDCPLGGLNCILEL